MHEEKTAFIEALERIEAKSLTACAGWTAHEVLAHIVAGGAEVAGLLQAHLDGQPVPATRGFEEREKPFRAMADLDLRKLLANSTLLEDGLRTAADQDPRSTIPFTEMNFTPSELLVHARSELALHRWDLTGHDEIGSDLMEKPELTRHAVKVLDGMRALNEWINNRARRAGMDESDRFEVVLRTPDDPDVVISYSNGTTTLEVSDDQGIGPCIESTAADRLLMLWGRRARTARSYLEPADLRRCEALLYA